MIAYYLLNPRSLLTLVEVTTAFYTPLGRKKLPPFYYWKYLYYFTLSSVSFHFSPKFLIHLGTCSKFHAFVSIILLRYGTFCFNIFYFTFLLEDKAFALGRKVVFINFFRCCHIFFIGDLHACYNILLFIFLKFTLCLCVSF